ncbi:MAG: hypothetical protein NVSMB14_11700 [Isosphaeraceae bacterium]
MTARFEPLIATFAATLAILLAIAPDAALPRALSLARAGLQDDGLDRLEHDRIERGDYERILTTERRLDHTAIDPHHSAHVPFDAGPLCLAVEDLREYVLKPNFKADLKGAAWSTNSRGLRDREYDPIQPADTFRIAFVGDSIGAGWGVADGEGFEPRLERALGERSLSRGGPKIEILNFAVPGHSPAQRWEHFRRAGAEFHADAVLYEATLADPGWDGRRLRGLLARGIGWDSPMFHDVLKNLNARPGQNVETYKTLLRSQRKTLLEGVYKEIVAESKKRGAPVYWVLVPRVGRPADPIERAWLIDLARSAGFDAAIDLSDAYEGLEPSTLAIKPDDFHPNVAGHARLADRLAPALAPFLDSSIERKAAR